MILPNEVKRKSFKNSDPETMIDAALKYSAYDNTMYCTLYLIGLTAADIKVLASCLKLLYNIIKETKRKKFFYVQVL